MAPPDGSSRSFLRGDAAAASFGTSPAASQRNPHPGETQRRPTVFDRHARLTTAALFAISVLGTELAFNASYRALSTAIPSTGSTRLRVPSPLYDHDFAPNVDVQEEHWGPWRTSYYTNSLGFRDACVRSVAPTPSGRRLVVIGDSFTEGMGVPYERTFVGRVARELAPDGIEVLNAGVASYCPIIYERKLRHLLDDVGLRTDEVAVYIDIGDIQDEVMYKRDLDGNVVPRHARRQQEGRANRLWGDPVFGRLAELEDFLDEHTLILARLYDFAHQHLRHAGSRAGMWTVDDALDDAYAREGLALAEQHMEELATTLRRHDVALTVAVYPWPDQIRVGDRDSRQVRFWRTFAERHGARFVDNFPCFVGAGDPESVLARDYIGGDIHWTEAGHAVVAAAFLRARAGRAACS